MWLGRRELVNILAPSALLNKAQVLGSKARSRRSKRGGRKEDVERGRRGREGAGSLGIRSRGIWKVSGCFILKLTRNLWEDFKQEQDGSGSAF